MIGFGKGREFFLVSATPDCLPGKVFVPNHLRVPSIWSGFDDEVHGAWKSMIDLHGRLRENC